MLRRSGAASRFRGIPGLTRLARAGLAAAALLALGGTGTTPIQAAPPKPGTDASGWPEISPEEKALTKVAEDPEANAVVLLKSRDSRIAPQADDFVNVMKYEWRAKILTERGKSYGEVHIRAGKSSRVDQIEARTIKPDGTVVPLAPDQIFEKVVLQAGGVKLTEKVFNLPAVEVGSILEYRYVRHDNGIFFLDPWFFAGEEYTVRSHVSQILPAGMSYSILCDLCPAVQPVITDWRDGKDKGQMYSMDLRGLPGYREERMMPPERETTPRLEMVLNVWKGRYTEAIGRQDRFFTDWESVARYVSFNYGHMMKDGQSALKPVVDDWVKGIADPQEKVKTILRHVRDDFRYLPWDNVYGGGLSSIATILKDKVADNEEKGVLLYAALKTAGIDGNFVLVAGKDIGSLNPKFYSLTQFTHVVVAIGDAGSGRKFLDPTVSYAPFEFTPWRDSGAGAVVINPTSGEVVDLPVRNEASTTRYRLLVKPSKDGKAEVELEAQYTGEDAIDLREELVPESAAGRETWAKKWLDERRSGTAVSSVSFDDLEDASKPLGMKLRFQASGLVTIADEAMLVRGCVLSCLDANPLARAVRNHPFYIDRGWNDEETVTIEPPAGLAASQMPPLVAARCSMATETLSCSAYGEGGARCVRQFSARRNRWPPTENGAARAMFDKIVQGDRTSVAFGPAEAPAAGAGGR
jgi:hypothetical protein